MNQNKVNISKSYYVKTLLLSLLIVSVLSLLIVWLYRYSAYQFHVKEIISHYQMSLLFEEKEIENKLDIFETDLDFLKSDKRFEAMIEGFSESRRADAAATFVYFMKSHSSLYDRLQYIDIKGDEIIKVETVRDITREIPGEHLQNKRERYYFEDILSLKFNGTYLSPFDLVNDEDSDGGTLNPVLRLGSPVFNYLGDKTGIIVLNIPASHFFRTILSEDVEMKIEKQLLNQDSYWISGGGEYNWGYLSDHPDHNMKQLNPDLWKKISEEKTGYKTLDHQTWIWNTVYPMKEYWQTRHNEKSVHAVQSVFWKTVLMIPEDEISSKIRNDYPPDQKILIWILMADLLFASLYAFIRAKNRSYSRQIEILATKDELTGCLNRRTGIEILEKQIFLSRRNRTYITVCFIDINDLKPVNDLMGHDKGDLLIKTTANIIEGTLRESDTICRMGGDEFLIILPDCDEEHADKILMRIETLIQARNDQKDLPFTISISRGLAEKSPDTGLKDTEELISRADQRMYENKRLYKLKKKEAGKNTSRP